MNTCSYINSLKASETRRRGSGLRCRRVLVSLMLLTTVVGNTTSGSFAGEQTKTATLLATQSNFADLFSREVLPSDSEVTAEEAVVLEQARGREQHDPTILRSRHVRTNFEVLQQAGPIRLPLFQDTYLTFEQDRVEQRGRNSYTVFGHVVGDKMSDAIFVVRNGMMLGEIRVDGKLYRVQSLSDNVQSIREIQESPNRQEAKPIRIDQAPNGDQYERWNPDRGQLDYWEMYPEIGDLFGDGPVVGDTGKVIDVLVVYTEKVYQATLTPPHGYPFIGLTIQFRIDKTNQAFINSGIDLRLNLVHKAHVKYVETGNSDTDLDLLRLNDDIHQLRHDYHADLVSLWVKDLDNCGQGFLPTPMTFEKEDYGFNVIDYHCGWGTFAHEVGHNLGLHHDRLNAKDEGGNPEEGAYPYSYGYRDPSGAKQWRTIMAYPEPPEGPCVHYCNMIPYFSNPLVTYDGTPTGLPKGDPNAADNAETLRNTKFTVANFRSSSIPQIITPGNPFISFSSPQTFIGQLDVAAELYSLDVGTTFGGKDIMDDQLNIPGYNGNYLPEFTVSGIPNGVPIYVRYGTRHPLGWKYSYRVYNRYWFRP